MKFKVGDRVVHTEALQTSGYTLSSSTGVIAEINTETMVIKWNSGSISDSPWTLDGRYGGKSSDGSVCIRKLTKLELALK